MHFLQILFYENFLINFLTLIPDIITPAHFNGIPREQFKSTKSVVAYSWRLSEQKECNSLVFQNS